MVARSQIRLQNFSSSAIDLIAAPWGFGGTDNLAQEGSYNLLADNQLIKKLEAVGAEINCIDPPELGPFELQDSAGSVRNLDAIMQVNTWVASQFKESLGKDHIPISR